MSTTTGTPISQSQSGGFSYAEYDRLVSKYVDQRGRVNYAALKKELPALRAFLDQLAAASPENRAELFATDTESKRYYLTAYNACVLYFAALAYPDRHALWAKLGWFKNKDIVLGGRKLTLNDLEHNIIRKKFLDPRIHFYLNCGAKSCPPLKAKAIAEGATEAELEEAARAFINDSSNVRFDAASRTLYLSKLFDWYEDDFINYLRAARGLARPHIVEYIKLYLDGSSAEALARVSNDRIRIKHVEYDKGLNDQ
ncbi:MAG TPA: DUF547 domain-containing protein [Blastocatellia bacterium]|nr:DUF547 domain-containing protein [Blastocatellia bacterium]